MFFLRYQLDVSAGIFSLDQLTEFLSWSGTGSLRWNVQFRRSHLRDRRVRCANLGVEPCNNMVESNPGPERPRFYSTIRHEGQSTTVDNLSDIE